MLALDYSTGIGRLRVSSNVQSYTSKASEALVEYTDKFFKQSEEIATEKSPPIDIPFNLEE